MKFDALAIVDRAFAECHGGYRSVAEHAVRIAYEAGLAAQAAPPAEPRNSPDIPDSSPPVEPVSESPAPTVAPTMREVAARLWREAMDLTDAEGVSMFGGVLVRVRRETLAEAARLVDRHAGRTNPGSNERASLVAVCMAIARLDAEGSEET